MSAPKKSLGQHWLTDRTVLRAIADEATITSQDTVLEIGPGLGTLTSELLRQARDVVAVELDGALAMSLPKQFPGASLKVVHQDILQFDLRTLADGYIVVANVPYYITAKIVQFLTTSSHPPKRIVLLVQKEVAERIAANVGDMSVLAVSAQLFADVRLGPVVPAALFTPPPKVDSQVVVLDMRAEPLVAPRDQDIFFRLVKAGFAERRKKIQSSLAHGLHMPKEEAVVLLGHAGISPDDRAQDVSLAQWLALLRHYKGSV